MVPQNHLPFSYRFSKIYSDSDTKNLDHNGSALWKKPGAEGVSFPKSKKWLLDDEGPCDLRRADRLLCLRLRPQRWDSTVLPRRPPLLRCALASNVAESISEKRPPWHPTTWIDGQKEHIFEKGYNCISTLSN